MNFHTKAFTFLLLLGLASLASAHGSLPSATPTAKTLHSQSPLGQARSVQDGSAPDVRGLIEVLPLVDGWLAFLEPALGNDLERQHFLNDLLPFFSVRLLLGRKIGRAHV